MKIIKLHSNELKEVTDLLSFNNLPVKDINESPVIMFGLYDDHTLIGCVGLEQFGEIGLLRSLAVNDQNRGKGIGKMLVGFLEKECPDKGILSLFLLTETAEEFFAKQKYLVIDRAHTPQELKQSAEFSYLCSDSAILMMKKL